MSTRTVNVFAFREKLTSAKLNKMPMGWPLRRRITTNNQSGISTETAITEYTEALNIPGADRALFFTASVNVYASVAASDIFAEVRIRDGGLGGSVVGYGTSVIREDDTDRMQTIVAIGTDLNVSGAHTYYVSLEVHGVATLLTAHSSTRPGCFVIQDMGPSS